MSARFVNPATVAATLGVSVRAVTRWCADGSVDGATKSPGGRWLIPRAFVAKFLSDAPAIPDATTITP